MDMFGVALSIFTAFFEVDDRKKLPRCRSWFLIGCMFVFCCLGRPLLTQAGNFFDAAAEAVLSTTLAESSRQTDETADNLTGYGVQADEAADNLTGHSVQADETADNLTGHTVQADGAEL